MSDQAVIKTGGKQYRVSTGSVIRVEKLEGDVGAALSFEPLAVGVGDSFKVGAPTVEGAKVEATIKAHGKGPKLIVYKFRRRKNYRRKNGHRQPYTELEVTAING